MQGFSRLDDGLMIKGAAGLSAYLHSCIYLAKYPLGQNNLIGTDQTIYAEHLHNVYMIDR